MMAFVAMIMPMGGVHCEDVKREVEHHPRMFAFKSAEMLDNYSVSGFWFPGKEDNIAGLRGPAVFVFNSNVSGEQWTIAVNAITLLDKNFWAEHQVADAAQLESEALLGKLQELGVVSISLSKDKRAKIVTCEHSENNPSQGKASVEHCLQLGDAVVDLQDIDFDGKKELVFRHAGMAQRGGDAYEIVRITEYDDYLSQDSGEPFRDFDFRTIINITRKQIIIEGSSGACDSTKATYSRDSSGRMNLTHFWRSVMRLPDNCGAEDYAVQNQVDGIGRCLKLSGQRKID